MALDLSGYVDVPTRLKMALGKHPELRVVEQLPRLVADGKFLEVTVTVYRDPDDRCPTVGTAWEPFPGQTPYTRNSEMMNAATSALGRALGYMGFGLTTAISTAEEVANRMAEKAPRRQEPQDPAGEIPRPTGARPASDAQKKLIRRLLAEKDHQFEGDLEELTMSAAIELIDVLKNLSDVVR